MSDRFIIELDSEAAGIVIREGGAFRFYAANRDFHRLEGRLFNTPQAAHKAAVRHQAARGRSMQEPARPRGLADLLTQGPPS